MHEVKCWLIHRYGLHCMLCKRKVELSEIQWHHIKPKYASRREGYPADDSESNASLVCDECHRRIHHYDYNDIRYKALMKIIVEYKNTH